MTLGVGLYTTKHQTADGKVYDLGSLEHAPKHDHPVTCSACQVVNAWTEKRA